MEGKCRLNKKLEQVSVGATEKHAIIGLCEVVFFKGLIMGSKKYKNSKFKNKKKKEEFS